MAGSSLPVSSPCTWASSNLLPSGNLASRSNLRDGFLPSRGFSSGRQRVSGVSAHMNGEKLGRFPEQNGEVSTTDLLVAVWRKLKDATTASSDLVPSGNLASRSNLGAGFASLGNLRVGFLPIRGFRSRRQQVSVCAHRNGEKQGGFPERNGEAFRTDLWVEDGALVWRKLKEVTMALVLSALIALPGSGGGALCVETADSITEPSLSAAECAARTGIGLAEDHNSIPAPEVVTNESVVDEAWQVVNQYFLDARHHSWSADDWMKVKEEVLRRPIRSKMAAYGAIKGMLATLRDPYTRFLTPDQFRELTKYDVTGIGLNIGEVENEKGKSSLAVLGIVLGSPAQLMGVRQGDELLTVDGTSVQGMSAFEAASLIQGPKGTPVLFEIRHGPCEDVKSITVARQQDIHTPVFYRLEHSQTRGELTGYIRLREFNALAKRDLVTAMKRLQDAGAKSFLLDLQDNPGGLVQAGIEIARLFLDGGETVIQIVGRDPTNYRSILATGVPLTRAPLMVLVNDRTASASEIVAAALHDNCRAILVGNRTFGKGLIQSVYELSDGSGLILTVGKYVTPGKIDIDGNGIEPDFKSTPGLSEAEQKLGRCDLQKLSATTSTRL